MQNKESIWADGCPANVSENSKLKIEELLLLAVDYVVKEYALKNGFMVEQAMANIQYLPNIIMKKNDQLYVVAVVPFVFPKYGYLNDTIRLEMVKNAKKFNAIPLFAPVGFKSIDEERAKAELALKGDLFNTIFRGFLVLTDEEHQNMIVPASDFIKI